MMNIPKLRDLKVYIEENLKKVVILVKNWAKDGSIIGVIEFDITTRCEIFQEIDQQAYNPRVVRKNVKKIQIFFKVQISLEAYKLAKV